MASWFGPRLPAQLESSVAGLAALGIEAEELDLRKFFGRPEALPGAMERYGMVWAVGGNAFVLRRAIRASGLEDVAITRVNDGSLIWAGFSAGAVVAAPTLQGIELVDDPEVTPDSYDTLPTVWEGLDLVPYSIAPHFHSDHPDARSIDQVVRFFSSVGLSFRALRDGEAIVVTGDRETIVGGEPGTP